jgi:hypothetical protein
MKLPDAIILATAPSRDFALTSRNNKELTGFAGVVSPYKL